MMEQCDDLQQAEAHLKRAESDLEAARKLEDQAAGEIKEAFHEIREAEHHQPDANHVAVEVATTSGFFPDGHPDRVPVKQPVEEVLRKAAKALNLTDTAGWVATVNKRVINIALSYEANNLQGCVIVDWGPPEGGGGA
jgi:hypothetical protein